jgi:hypothetical protein
MDLEALVRDALREHATEAPSADSLGSAVARRRGRRGRWLAAGLSTAAVIALAVSLASLGDSSPALHHPPATDGDRPMRNTPPGYTRVAYHEFTVAVPSGLPVITSPCVAPARYVLAENPLVSYSCVAGGVPTAEQTLTVRLTAAQSAPTDIATTPTEIDGLSASVGYGSLDGYPGVAGEAIFRGQDLAVVVTAPDRATVEQVLTSVERGPDPNGCPDDFPAPADPVAAELVPGAPSSAVRCVYAVTQTGYVLQASLPVHRAALDALVHAINALPTDAVITSQPPFEYDLLRIDYPDGSTRTVRIDLNDPTEYSDGDRAAIDAGNAVTDQLREATS